MADSFKTQYTRIKGLSERRRLPRLGKIRLGIKVPIKGKDPAKCECRGMGCYKCTRPIETPYFVCPKEVQAKYGKEPTKLRVMLPVNDLDVVFPCRLVWYGISKGPKCIGNGEQASRVQEDGNMKEIPCPCEKLEAKQCHQNSRLFVTLHEINFGGVYEISSGSTNSMIDIPSGLDYTQALIGRFAMVPLFLERVPTITHYEGKKATHYPLAIRLETNDPQFINALRLKTNEIITEADHLLLPTPDSLNPDLEGPVITDWHESTDGASEANEPGTADRPAPLASPSSPAPSSGGVKPGSPATGDPAEDPGPEPAAGDDLPDAVFTLHSQIKGVTYSKEEPGKFKILSENNIVFVTRDILIASLCKDVAALNPRPYIWIDYTETNGEKLIVSAKEE